MTDNRNTILAVILSGLVLIAWQYFYNVPQMERQRLQTQAQTEMAKPSPQTAPGWLAGVVADGVEPGVGVVEPGAVCGDCLASSAWVWVCARCRSICGTL